MIVSRSTLLDNKPEKRLPLLEVMYSIAFGLGLNSGLLTKYLGRSDVTQEKQSNNKAPSKNHGFSLLEILISLVIMSVGMMGLAGLKLVAIKGTNEAHFRHEASLLMADLADRMRANEAGVDNGTYKLNAPIDLSTVPSPDCSNTACTANELAEYDQYQIALKMNAAMPSSSLLITCPGNACNTVADVKADHTIAINWKERKDKSENLTKTVTDGSGNEETVSDEFNDRNITLVITP